MNRDVFVLDHLPIDGHSAEPSDPHQHDVILKDVVIGGIVGANDGMEIGRELGIIGRVLTLGVESELLMDKDQWTSRRPTRLLLPNHRRARSKDARHHRHETDPSPHEAPRRRGP